MLGGEVSISQKRQSCKTNRQIESKAERERESEGEGMSFPDRPSLFGCALLCSTVQLKEERGTSLQEGDKLTMESRGRSRGWLSARREQQRSGGEELRWLPPLMSSTQTARRGVVHLKTKRHPGLMKYT